MTDSGFIGFLSSHYEEILQQTWEHIWITLIALILATLLGLSLGVLLSVRKRLSGPVLGFVNVIQTVPSIALLGFLLPFMGIGVLPAITALFLYGLLPIVRNTYTGINNVDKAVKEAARGMGMTRWQQLLKVELPLASPVIFAGIRTAMVINIGVATLCALIAAGGLGTYIFRGISLNNTYMILAGAIPASLLALLMDALLGLIQRYIRHLIKPLLYGFVLLCLAVTVALLWPEGEENSFRAGFPSEFIKREDGLPGLLAHYEMEMPFEELEIGLMYQALANGDVDVISGLSTDGRIRAYNLRVLRDDRGYFPPYHAAAVLRAEAIQLHPQLLSTINFLADRLSDSTMAQLNYQVDEEKRAPRDVAEAFLRKEGFALQNSPSGKEAVVIGSKAFTENFILAELYGLLLEREAGIPVEMRQGFGGTKLLYDALKAGEVGLYPEYSGTALLVLLQADKATVDRLGNDAGAVFGFVKEQMQQRDGLHWSEPLGFNNTFALMMREEMAAKHGIRTITDLQLWLESQK